MDFKFADLGYSNQIGIVFRRDYVFRVKLPRDFPPIHKEALTRFLELIKYAVNQLPPSKTDELCPKKVLGGEFPVTEIAVRILRMGEKT